MKTGVIDVGGGMRDIYGAGAFDFFLEEGIHFDFCIGVSAGSANLASFLAGQKGRNYVSYTEYSFRSEYMGWGNWIKSRNYVNLDYIHGTLSNADGEYPLDFAAVMENPAEFKIVATDAHTGKPYYFDKSDMHQDDYGAIKASSCVPVVNKPYIVNGIPYFDGGFSDPIPIDQCLEAGCDRILLILTRPGEFRRDPAKDKTMSRLLKYKYPQSARAMVNRAELYNSQLDRAVSLEKQGKIFILAPDNIFEMKTLTRDKVKMDALYQKGKEDARKAVAFITG